MKKNISGTLILWSVFLTGCSTYQLSTQSMLGQFANTGTEKKTTVLPIPPYIFFMKIVNGNDLKEIKCMDKKGQEQTITVTNRTSIRITKLDNTSTTFYFDTLILKDSTITGSKTHFFNARIQPIRFNDISKIEIQR